MTAQTITAIVTMLVGAVNSQKHLFPKTVITDPALNPYMIYENYNEDGKKPLLSDISSQALKITSPDQCWGPNFEMFEQLQSPEWQLCETDSSTANEKDLYVCQTENPGMVFKRWKKNNV